MVEVHICGESLDEYLGLPPPSRPRCSNGHRERYMDYRSRIGDQGRFRCMKCRAEVTWQDNIQGEHNDWYRARVARFEKRIRERFGGE